MIEAGGRARRRILTLGGHDFGPGPGDSAITDLIVSLAGRPQPRLCLLPTASGDPTDQIARFHRQCTERGAITSDISLFRLGKRPVELRDHLLAQDLIYAGGGSLVNLLAIWAAHEVAEVMRSAWEMGIVIAGQSAGAMCWYEQGISRGTGQARVTAGLGLLPGACSVHYHSEPERRTMLHRAVAAGGPPGYGLDDGAGLLWEDREIVAAYSAGIGASVFKVEIEAGRLAETKLEATPVSPRPRPGPPPEISEYRMLQRAERARAASAHLRRGRLPRAAAPRSEGR